MACADATVSVPEISELWVACAMTRWTPALESRTMPSCAASQPDWDSASAVTTMSGRSPMSVSAEASSSVAGRAKISFGAAGDRNGRLVGRQSEDRSEEPDPGEGRGQRGGELEVA